MVPSLVIFLVAWGALSTTSTSAAVAEPEMLGTSMHPPRLPLLTNPLHLLNHLNGVLSSHTNPRMPVRDTNLPRSTPMHPPGTKDTTRVVRVRSRATLFLRRTSKAMRTTVGRDPEGMNSLLHLSRLLVGIRMIRVPLLVVAEGSGVAVVGMRRGRLSILSWHDVWWQAWEDRVFWVWGGGLPVLV